MNCFAIRCAAKEFPSKKKGTEMGWSEKHVRSKSESMKRGGDEIHFITENVSTP